MQATLSALQPVHDQPDDPKQPSDGMALCLSGGGYRAMLFHLGTLWRLNELHYLPKLNRVSSVSGGSITNGVLALNWKQARASTATALPIILISRLRNPFDAWPRSRLTSAPSLKGIFGGVSKHVADHYNKYLFNHAKLNAIAERREGPRFVFNATSLQTGVLWRFSKPYMGDWKVGLVMNPDVELATAVAASSAFPPVCCRPACCISTRIASTLISSRLRKLRYPGISQADCSLRRRGVRQSRPGNRMERNKTVLVSDGGGAWDPKPIRSTSGSARRTAYCRLSTTRSCHCARARSLSSTSLAFAMARTGELGRILRTTSWRMRWSVRSL